MTEILAGTRFSDLHDDQKNSLATSIRRGEYNLFLGAGTSLDAKNVLGDPLPSSSQLKDDLCNIASIRTTSSLQRAFGLLTPKQIDDNVTQRFLNCVPGPSVEKLPSFLWRRIFTLNVDDVIEAAYKLPGNLQIPQPFHFKDTFRELRTLDEVPIIHLHGRALEAVKGYVFARSQYARAMAEPNAWMTILAEIMPVEPFIVAGSALDEIDLDYYLARRSSTSAREDRGPSFYVEPFPDSQSESECNKYGLTLYRGQFREFLDELDSLVPERSTPYGLISTETKDLFPSDTSKGAVLAFASDFDIVPTNLPLSAEPAKFFYGGPPSWSDLASNWDVGRALSSRLRSITEAMLRRELPEKLILVSESIGTGKTTVLRRVAYDLRRNGILVLACSALSRIDPRITASLIDLIDTPLAVMVDNFAEQAASIAAIIQAIEKPDVVFFCAERSYRERYITSVLGVIPCKVVSGLDLRFPEALQLVETYIKRGIAGARDATRQPRLFANRLVGEPMAVACCHILNDMRPLGTFVKSAYEAASAIDRKRYLVAALAQYCFSGGVRYDVLAGLFGRSGWAEQFDVKNPLPLAYSDGPHREFVVPLNATMGEHTLECAPSNEVMATFERLALGVASRVNRTAIKMRSPEARLAGRLFDYEDVLARFLGSDSGAFYARVQSAWQWNSRYWEQIALYNLAEYRRTRSESFLSQAIQHARHAASIETHPFPLTTLATVLLAQMGLPDRSTTGAYGEAHNALIKATELERQYGRTSIHAYITLFAGTLHFMELGGYLTNEQDKELKQAISGASQYLARDLELAEVTERLKAKL